jgi:hypothetical protein
MIKILYVLYFKKAIELENFYSIVIDNYTHEVPAKCSFFFGPLFTIVAYLWIRIELQIVTWTTFDIKLIEINAK